MGNSVGRTWIQAPAVASDTWLGCSSKLHENLNIMCTCFNAMLQLRLKEWNVGMCGPLWQSFCPVTVCLYHHGSFCVLSSVLCSGTLAYICTDTCTQTHTHKLHTQSVWGVSFSIFRTGKSSPGKTKKKDQRSCQETKICQISVTKV